MDSIKVVRFASTFLLISLLLANVSYACIGLVAGKIHFNVSAGSNETLQMQVFNSCTNQSVYFSTLAQVDPLTNMTSPTIVMSPKNGTLAPRQNLFINITTYMPYNAIKNTTWRAGAAVQEANNATAAQGGATLSVGVVKLFGITALPPKPVPFIYYVVAGAAVAAGVAAAGGYYYFRVRKRARGAAPKPARVAKAKHERTPIPEEKMTYAEFKRLEAERRKAGRKRR